MDFIHASLAQFIRIEADAFKIAKSNLASEFQGADDFSNRFAAAFATGNIVNGEIRDSGIESGVRERQFAHVPIVKPDALGDSFERGIPERSLARIVALIHLRP